MRPIGHKAMLEQDAVHIGCEADLAAEALSRCAGQAAFSERTVRHRSSGQRHASQHLD